ncbi:DUF2089-like zinc ribbon domain-containing protein [Labilibacter marinus]|uniref:DUF2089-like zinc ribbon domain-containing protein n=1 Tax=Labilibacter marinus TaxID=1477105 RepID=UPI00082B6DE3|nr:DUF2089 family protein [Labilibacter marinus]
MTEQKLPLACPSCSNNLHVTHMHCNNCETKIEGNYALPSLLKLTPEEQSLMIAFIKSNGSPKRLGAMIDASYPVVRQKLDDLIKRLEEI